MNPTLDPFDLGCLLLTAARLLDCYDDPDLERSLLPAVRRGFHALAEADWPNASACMEQCRAGWAQGPIAWRGDVEAIIAEMAP